MTAAAKTYEGSCFCGKVRYRYQGALGPMTNCHCTDCRKSHAAAFATYIDAKKQGFAFLQGEEHLQTYKAATGTKRTFCRHCGSIVICHGDAWPDLIEISASTLDTPIDLKPEHHGWVKSKASWYDILDGKPQYPKNKDG